MRNIAYPLVALCIIAAIVQATELPNGQQANASEKQQFSKQSTRNPEAYSL
jgi:hypothetical protein